MHQRRNIRARARVSLRSTASLVTPSLLRLLRCEQQQQRRSSSTTTLRSAVCCAVTHAADCIGAVASSSSLHHVHTSMFQTHSASMRLLCYIHRVCIYVCFASASALCDFRCACAPSRGDNWVKTAVQQQQQQLARNIGECVYL